MPFFGIYKNAIESKIENKIESTTQMKENEQWRRKDKILVHWKTLP